MRILLLNQFVPPEKPPTARLLGDLAEALNNAGWQTQCLGCGQGYQQTARGGLARVLRDLAANLRLLIAGLRAPCCDWVLCLSDPPGLPFTAAVIAFCKRARLAHWAMDVYPQTAVALGALRPGLISNLVRKAMGFAYRRSSVLVALDGDMREILEQSGGSKVQELAPWPPALSTTPPAVAMATPQPEERVWLYSGNLGRAHEFADLLAAQQIVEKQGVHWRLVFQGGGPARDAAQQMASTMGLQRCEWRDYAPDDLLLPELQAADVLIATQKPALTGLIWPSKLALMTLLEKPVLWLGPTTSQVAQELRRRSTRHGVFGPGQGPAIADWLLSQPPASPSRSANEVQAKISAVRDHGLQQWETWLKQEA